ncbi:MAG: FAD-dependent monooxygenase [Acidimicrobiales bacterium]
MTDVPVCIIGCGPIGLAGALLLSRHGVPSLVVERRGELNQHPRSRFVDTNTMELLREFGADKEVEATGLGPDWTTCNRWSDTLAVEPFAQIPSPTFLNVRRSTSPCIPAMTVQDVVEAALFTRVTADPDITVRFGTEAVELAQTDDHTQIVLRDVDTGDREEITSLFTIGADGPGSRTREVIGTGLEVEPRPVFMQDVMFDADLSEYVGDRKGSLLYTQPPEGVLIFQPLDGRRRWRCQIVVADEHLISEDAAMARIQASLGTVEPVELTITSMRMWQPTPGCVTRFSSGRIFLAGDAAHVSIPTGGLGNNTGFAGIRNLAWKLAYVVRGLAPASILETYEVEHRPLATERIAVGVAITDHMGPMMVGHRRGVDITDHFRGTHLYGNYDHVLHGFELASDLIAPESVPPEDLSPLEPPSAGFAPCVRSGRRAPHVWVDEGEALSVLDWYGSGYVALLGPDCDRGAWADALEAGVGGVPLTLRQLPANRDIGPYARDEVVLVRPDGIIADHWTDAGDGPDLDRLLSRLPTTNSPRSIGVASAASNVLAR